LALRELAAVALRRNLHDQLAYLRRSGRLTDEEMDEMFTGGLLVKAPGEAACRKEGQRPGSPCPLLHRARHGDRTVPCIEAKNASPPKAPPSSSGATATAAADPPGDPEDPVQVLHIRPCFLLGNLSSIVPDPLAGR
jgi:hypothetical protein